MRRAWTWASLAASSYVAMWLWVGYSLWSVAPGFEIIPVEDTNQTAAIDLYFQKQEWLASVTLGLLAALWAFTVLGDKLRVRTTADERASIGRVSASDRVDVLSRYLNVRGLVANQEGEGRIGKDDVADFDWSYVTDKRIRFGAVAFKPDRPTTIRFVKSDPLTAQLTLVLPEGEKRFVTVPVFAGKDVVLQTEAAGSQSDSEPIQIAGLGENDLLQFEWSLRRRVQIQVKSDPTNAKVEFNDKPYHRATNTSAVQDPGTWKVTIRCDGYKEWSASRTLGEGAVWNIDEKLEKLETPVKKDGE